MGVRDFNILEMGVLNTDEARELFMSQIGNQVDVEGYENVVERLLRTCRGYPHVIVSTGNSLKEKDLTSWAKFAHDLEKPIASQVGGVYRHNYSIIDKSYKFLEVVEKRIFLLLACLFPLGSSVSIESLTRYGIGLNLFPRIDKLYEAMELSDKWANELVLSSMLLKGDFIGDVKIHDFVRAFAILFAAEAERHNFLVDIVPHMLDDETFKEYTAISLMSADDCYRLSGVKAGKLQILKLRGDLSRSFTDSFFEEMPNLEVLDLSNMNFQPSLPESMRKLKKLRTLCMVDCKLEDIKLIGELVNLLVLSLRGSFVEELPHEIGNLCELRLLDLNGCRSNNMPLIPFGVLGRLSSLEGLYMLTKEPFLQTRFSDEGTSATENNKLPYLNVLEIGVPTIERKLFDCPSVRNLDKFKVFVGSNYWIRVDVSYMHFCRVVGLDCIDDVGGVLENTDLKALSKRADWFGIRKCNKFENIVPQLDQDGFKYLRFLCVNECDDIECIVNGCKMNDLIAFPRLRSLRLYNLKKLKIVCDGKAPNLVSLVGPKMFCSTSDALPQPQSFFDGQIIFPSLEQFELKKCHNIEKLWSKEVFGFQNLKNLDIENCGNLSSVGSPRIFSSLVRLESLCIRHCLGMCEVVTVDESEEAEDLKRGAQINIFSQLKYLTLGSLSNLHSFYGAATLSSTRRRRATLCLPSLEKLSVVDCPKIEHFWLGFFVAPELQDLDLDDCPLMLHFLIEEEDVINLPSLQTVHIRNCPNMKSISPGCLTAPNLKEVKLRECNSMQCFLEKSNHNGCTELPSLEKVHIRKCPNIKSFSGGRLLAPKLTHMLYDETEYLSAGDKGLE
ncbi:hypothetical protein RND81_05G248500 [Saponaria officinalis]|uniref:Disease resistance protein At4g27190-like leucine-rich repeats domain-containing protein n=1 Tax=Saponaria officinalis TaxID=3572 RepID=A0AAW1L3P1_SAPOF